MLKNSFTAKSEGLDVETDSKQEKYKLGIFFPKDKCSIENVNYYVYYKYPANEKYNDRIEPADKDDMQVYSKDFSNLLSKNFNYKCAIAWNWDWVS